LRFLETAARAGDALRFFTLARAAVVATQVARGHPAPEQITAAEIEARLGAAAGDVQQLFALADEVNYAGQQPTSTDYERWLTTVRRMLHGEAAA
jgi:hypothetical protein